MWKKKQWSDMTQIQKTGIVIIGILQIAMLTVAQWDIHHRPEEEIRGNKWVWTAIACINFVGPISYFLIGRSKPGQKRIILEE